jgi:hypothetical protein
MVGTLADLGSVDSVQRKRGRPDSARQHRPSAPDLEQVRPENIRVRVSNRATVVESFTNAFAVFLVPVSRTLLGEPAVPPVTVRIWAL